MEKNSFDRQLLLNSPDFIESKKYWTKQLKSASFSDSGNVFNCGKGRKSSEYFRSEITDSIATKLLLFCKHNDLAVYVYLMTAYCILIKKYTNAKTVAVASPLFNEKFNQFPTLFNNILPIVSRPDQGNTFRDQLIEMTTTVLNSAKNQHYPLEAIYNELAIDDLAESIDTTIICKSVHKHDHNVNTNAAIYIEITQGRIALKIESLIATPFSLSQFFDHLQAIIECSIENVLVPIHEITFLKEKDTILQWSNSSRNQIDNFSLLKQLQSQFSKGSNGMAISYGDIHVSYVELEAKIDKLSRYLLEHLHLGKGERVGVLVGRSEWILVSLISLLKNGMVYVPIDINYPDERIKYIIEDAKASIIITEEPLLRLVSGAKGVVLESIFDFTDFALTEQSDETIIAGDDEAYIIYTSGSNGIPKGVIVTHDNLNHFFGHVWREYVDAEPLVLPFIASHAFDISIFQLISPILTGGTCVVIDNDQLQNFDDFIKTLRHVTAIDTVPGLYKLLINYIFDNNLSSAFKHIRRIFIGGDLIPDALLGDISKVFSEAVVTVTYGPTEGTIFTTHINYYPGSVTSERRGSIIGYPISGSEIYIVNESIELCPEGIIGEICIGGRGVSTGYVNRKDLTAEKFITNPFNVQSKSRLYKTGDLGLWLYDGRIEFKGRNDNQIKLRGFRIEPEEIESHIRKYDCIEDAVVTTAPNKDSGGALIAYYTKKRSIQVWPSISEYLSYNDIAYFAMNNDALRFNSYKSAIEKHVMGKTVLDVGTGPDAILAQCCIAAGAKKVYAVEILKEVYLKAKNKIESLGLSNKIILIHGDMLQIELPEKVDYCVCALVGNLGSSDGCIPIMNSARRFLKNETHMIPYRSVTRIAATNLSNVEVCYKFTDTGAGYLNDIFSMVGRRFDLRIGLQNVSENNLFSTTATFEELDLTKTLPLDDETSFELKILEDAQIDGFVLWLNLYTTPDIIIDIFRSQKSFLPIYFPVFEQSVAVTKNDIIRCKMHRKTPLGSIYPDYQIDGELIRANNSNIRFAYRSERLPNSFCWNLFYRKVFPNGLFQVKSKFSVSSIRQYLKAKVPEYMVPSLWMELERIPLNVNQKLDRDALPKPESQNFFLNKHIPPNNEIEEQIVNIWQELLGVSEVSVHDNFFELGGDSIISIQVVSRAKRAGYDLQPRDIFVHQTIRSLSTILLARGTTNTFGEQGLLLGSCGLLPVQRSYLDSKQKSVSHFNQSALLGLSKDIDADHLGRVITVLLEHHDSLRFLYQEGSTGWKQNYGTFIAPLVVEDLSQHRISDIRDIILEKSNFYQRSLDIFQGELVRVVLLKTPREETHDRLLIVVHHLAIDALSWRILLEDFESLLDKVREDEFPSLGVKSHSYRDWYNALLKYSQSDRLLSQRKYWAQVCQNLRPIPVDNTWEQSVHRLETATYNCQLSTDYTKKLLKDVPGVYHTEINDLLLAALTKTLGEWIKSSEITIGLENIGREQIENGIDISRTTGWFTCLYPIKLVLVNANDPGDLIKRTKEQLREVPDKGLGYGVLKYMTNDKSLPEKLVLDMVFNYLGQFDNVIKKSKWFIGVEELQGDSTDEEFTMNEKIVINCMISGGVFIANWRYSKRHYERETIVFVAEKYLSHLALLIDHCLEQGNGGPMKTPSDYGLTGEVSYKQLEVFLDEQVNGISRRYQIEGLSRLSPLQEGMLFHSLYDSQAQVYVEQFECILTGVDEEIFRQSWEYLLEKHSILRTAFFPNSLPIPVECIYRKAVLPMEILDIRFMNEADQKAALNEYLFKDRMKKFDFNIAPLMRIALLRTSVDTHWMIWTHHHIIMDGWSLPILAEELLTNYESLLSGKPIEVIEKDSYEDYIRYIEAKDKHLAETFWRKYLEGVTTPTLLPFISSDNERNKGIGIYKKETLCLNEQLTERIEVCAQAYHLTINTIMQGVWSCLLHKYTGDNDITFGVTVSGRPDDLPAIETRVGLYINTIPLHSILDINERISCWLASIQHGQSEGRDYQYTGLRDIQNWIGINGDMFDTLMVFENYPVNEMVASRPWKLQVKGIEIKDQANYPLIITITKSHTITIDFSYNTALLHEYRVRQIRDQFRNVLNQIIEKIDSPFLEVELLTEDERHRILKSFNDTIVDYPKNVTVVDLFETQAQKTPHRVAVTFGSERITYKELNERSNKLAHYLIKQGVKEETLVPICMERGINVVIGIIGILKAGGAYVPIDPQYPQERINYIIDDTETTLMLCSGLCKSKLTDLKGISCLDLDAETELMNSQPGNKVMAIVNPRHLAYVIYTSGSTGVPKGAKVLHRGVTNLIYWYTAEFGLNPDDSNLILSSIGFDLTQKNIFGTLATGGVITMVHSDYYDVQQIVNYIHEKSVTIVNCAPSAFYPLVADDIFFPGLSSLRLVILGGESIGLNNLAQWITSPFFKSEIVNSYGPTECTDIAAFYRIKNPEAYLGKSIPIGRPNHNVQLLILSESADLQPIGIKGEICISGDGVGTGYLNDDEQTARKFVQNPFGEGTLYKTGDIGRWSSDGNVEYLGRKDDQIKIRGYRIELGEIESIIQQFEQVSRAVVVVKATEHIDYLISYVVTQKSFDEEALREYLRPRLPEYMIPSYFMKLESMPLTPNGKIDKKALPDPDYSLFRTNNMIAPRTEIECVIAAIWREQLKVDQIGIYDNFFKIGGHSLLATRIVAAIQTRLGVTLSVRVLFEFPTLEALGRYLELLLVPDIELRAFDVLDI